MTTNTNDYGARLWVQPKSIEYGFLDGTELLHLYKAEEFGESTSSEAVGAPERTYQLMHKVAEVPSYGAWTTDSLATVVMMYLTPDKYKEGLNRYNPKLTYQGPPPVAIYTWHASDGWSALNPVHKSYVPIRLPETLPPKITLRELRLDLGDGISNTLYVTQGQGAEHLAADTVYYIPQDEEFYACIGKVCSSTPTATQEVETKYLMIGLRDEELEERLLSNHRNLLPRFT